MVNYCWYLCQNSCGRFRLCWQSTWTDMQLPFFLALCRIRTNWIPVQTPCRNVWEAAKTLLRETAPALAKEPEDGSLDVFGRPQEQIHLNRLNRAINAAAVHNVWWYHFHVCMGGCIGTVSFFDVLSTPHAALVGRFINWSRDYPGEFFEMLRCKIILVLATQARVVGLVLTVVALPNHQFCRLLQESFKNCRMLQES